MADSGILDGDECDVVPSRPGERELGFPKLFERRAPSRARQSRRPGAKAPWTALPQRDFTLITLTPSVYENRPTRYLARRPALSPP